MGCFQNMHGFNHMLSFLPDDRLVTVTLSPPSRTPHQRRDIQCLHTALGLVRLLMASAIMYWVWQSTDVAFLYDQQLIGLFSAIYAGLAFAQTMFFVLRPMHDRWAPTSSYIDLIWCILLLWFLPNQAWIGLIIPITLWLAALCGWSLFGLFLNLASLCAAAALTAQYQGILLNTRIDMLPHGIIAFASLIAFIMPLYGRVAAPILSEQSWTTGQLGLPDQHKLIDALQYLIPVHQRNLSPLSLLMIQLPSEKRAKHAVQLALIPYLQTRIRQSDVLVQTSPRHLTLLLCDTDESGASQLAQDIQEYRLNHAQTARSGLEIAICRLPMTQFAVALVLDRMLNSLSHAEKHQVTRIVFVSAS
jgi:hypothetical protein